jgi:hypothetical protein
MRFSLALLLTGCSAQFPMDLYIDRWFEASEQCLAVEATQRWEAAASEIDIDAYIGLRHWGYPNQINRATEAKAQQLSSDEYVGLTCRRSNGARGPIYIVPSRIAVWAAGEMYSRVFLTVAMHELGHLMGLEHTAKGSAGVMVSHVSQESDGCLSQADVDAFCKHWGCSLIAPQCEPVPEQCQ